MTNPQSLHLPLLQLLKDIESKDEPQACTHAKALIEELDIPISARNPRGAGHKNVPVPFSGFHPALLKKVRSAARQITTGNWAGAANTVREALVILTEWL